MRTQTKGWKLLPPSTPSMKEEEWLTLILYRSEERLVWIMIRAQLLRACHCKISQLDKVEEMVLMLSLKEMGSFWSLPTMNSRRPLHWGQNLWLWFSCRSTYEISVFWNIISTSIHTTSHHQKYQKPSSQFYIIWRNYCMDWVVPFHGYQYILEIEGSSGNGTPFWMSDYMSRKCFESI